MAVLPYCLMFGLICYVWVSHGDCFTGAVSQAMSHKRGSSFTLALRSLQELHSISFAHSATCCDRGSLSAVGKLCFHILITFAELPPEMAILPRRLCFRLFSCECVSHRDRFVSSNKRNKGSLLLVFNFHALHFLVHYHFTLIEQSAMRYEQSEINLVGKQYFHILFDISALSSRTSLLTTFIFLSVLLCVLKSWGCCTWSGKQINASLTWSQFTLAARSLRQWHSTSFGHFAMC